MRRFKIFLVQLLIGTVLFVNNESVQATDLTKEEKGEYRYIIQQELMYPRPCRLLLPFQISKAEKGSNRYVLDLVNSLTKNNIVVIKQDKQKNISIYPGPNTSDVIQAHVNLAYDITNINLILGIYKIKVEDVEEKDGLLYVHGYRHVKGKTRIFHQVLEALPQVMAKAYTTKPMTWKIARNKDNSYEVEEIGLLD